MVKSDFISTARIPVIKLTFDTASLGYEPSELEVDITLTDSSEDPHFMKGFAIISVVQAAVAIGPELRPVILLLKKLLDENRLNIPYEGGIGSLPLIAMLMSFYNTFTYQGMTSAEILVNFLNYYGKSFSPEKASLTWYGEKERIEKSSVFEIQHPTDSTFNMASSSYRMHEV